MKRLSLLSPGQERFLKGDSSLSNPRREKKTLLETRILLPDFVENCFWEIRQMAKLNYDDAIDRQTKQKLKNALKSEDFKDLISSISYEDKKEIISAIFDTMLITDAENFLKELKAESKQLRKFARKFMERKGNKLRQRAYSLLPQKKAYSKGGQLLDIRDLLADDNEISIREFRSDIWPEIVKRNSLKKPITDREIRQIIGDFLNSKKKADYKYLKASLTDNNQLRTILKESLKQGFIPNEREKTRVFIGKLSLSRLVDGGILEKRKSCFEITRYGKNVLKRLLT